MVAKKRRAYLICVVLDIVIVTPVSFTHIGLNNIGNLQGGVYQACFMGPLTN
jgi:hypothetical protein